MGSIDRACDIIMVIQDQQHCERILVTDGCGVVFKFVPDPDDPDDPDFSFPLDIDLIFTNT